MSEIITLGLGNYGVLCAAHWANSTTKYDVEHRAVYTETAGGKRAVRLLLLDQAQVSRIAKEIPLDNQDALQHAPAAVRVEDDDDAEGSNDDDEEDDEELDYGWTWRTATRHPETAPSTAKKHIDPEEEDQQHESHVEVDEGALQAELDGPPPLRVVPWWKYITAPTNRNTLLTQAYFDDPQGGYLAHSFGFGYHQKWDGDRGSCATYGTAAIVGLETYADRVRRSIEDSDCPQGLQLFVDADSAFGGVACGLLNFLREDFEDVKATVAHSVFPAVHFPATDDFVKRRRQEVLLNRALATCFLAEHAALYTPFEVNQWSMPHFQQFDVDDDVSTAAIVASAADNAFYASRQARGASASGSEYRSLSEMCGLLRPGSSMRILAAAQALPLPVPPPKRSDMVRKRGGSVEPPSLWSVMEGAPLLKRDPWRSLTFDFASNLEMYHTDSYRVEAHAVTLRGIGGFPEVEYPRAEAALRYAWPLRQLERYSCSLFDELYPVSSSFPADRLFGAPKVRTRNAEGQMTTQPAPEGIVADGPAELSAMRVATHLVNTHQSAAYLDRICQDFDRTKYDRNVLHLGYGFESDEWVEVRDVLYSLRDTYDRGIICREGEEDDIE